MTADGVRFRVTDTQKKAGDLFVHIGTVEQGTLKAGLALALDVDRTRRSAIRRNHSATHLLHEALRQVLGDHVAQKGSLVAPDRLRFDFSHPKPMTAEEIEKVEDLANDYVLQNSPVTTRLMALDDARASGARALFGEKYGDEVRVVAMGEGGGNALGWSVELCGGTHVAAHRRHRRDLGLSDAGVAAGVRRIEALTGAAARKACQRRDWRSRRRRHRELRVSLEDLPGADRQPARRAQEARARTRRRQEEARHGRRRGVGGGRRHARRSAASSCSRERSTASTLKDLRSLADEGKKQVGSGVVAIVGTTEQNGKAGLVVGVTADLTGRVQRRRPGQRRRAEALGGKGGGGRPDMAQAGGPDGCEADAALAAIEKLVKPA